MAWLRNKTYFLVAWAIIGVIFIINSQYITYTDEFINVLGGRALLRMQLPYVGFFDSHMPGPWFLSAILWSFSFGSYIVFRYWWAFVQYAGCVAIGWWVARHAPRYFITYTLATFLYAIVAVFLWLHLILGDSIAVWFAFMVVPLLLIATLDRSVQLPTRTVALLTAGIIFGSLTYAYFAVVLYVWQWWVSHQKKKTIVWACLPWALWAIYLLVSWTWYEFIYANIIYNTRYYITVPNYVPGRFFNPLKFGVVLLANFMTGFLPAFAQLSSFNLYQPIIESVALGIVLLTARIARKGPIVATLFVIMICMSAPRSEVIANIKETDYQIGMFVVMGLIAASFAVVHHGKDTLVEKLAGACLVVYVGATMLFLSSHTYLKWVKRYTQKEPYINQVAEVATFIDEIAPGEKIWYGPYEPQQAFFIRRAQWATQFPAIFPAFAEAKELQKIFLDQLVQVRPRMIVFKHEASVFGNPADRFGDFLIQWMQGRYVNCEQLQIHTMCKDHLKEINIPSDVYVQVGDIEMINRLRK